MSELVKFKHSVAQHTFIFNLIKKLVLKIKEIEHYETLKLNPQITQGVCEMIKEEMSKLKKTLAAKIDARELARESLKQVFELTEEELKFIDSQLDYMLDNKLIKQVSVFKKAEKWLLSLLRRP